MINEKKSTHAEIDAFKKLKINHDKKKNIKNLNLVVIRVNKSGELCESKPCIHCMNYLNKNIYSKGYRIKNIIYSTKNSKIVKKKFMYLLKNTNHISRCSRLYKL